LSENGYNNGIKRRGPYKRMEKLHIIHEIERLLTAGYNSSYIQQQLRLSERTYSRYRQAAFKDEKEALLSLSVDFVMEQLAESARRYRQLYDQAVKISEDKSVDGETRVYALNTAAEFEKQRIFFIVDSPNKLSQLRGYPKSVELAAKNIERKYPQLKLIKNNRELPEHY
jgi:alkyl hydroperoxide reductase subunit AhpC